MGEVCGGATAVAYSGFDSGRIGRGA